jgi:two-component system chemotaxis response regulator CheV
MGLDHGILLETGTNEFEIVEFIIKSGNKPYHFCINVAKVREVIKFPEVVHVPDAHRAIVGTANIRQNLVFAALISAKYWPMHK